jgi:hypothetical protein
LNRINQDEKVDVYDFGLILLEILLGRSLTSGNDVDVLQDQVTDIFLWFLYLVCRETLSNAFSSSLKASMNSS